MNTTEQQMPERWGLTRAPQPGPVGTVCVQSVVQDGEVAVRTRPTCSPYHREGCVESERTVKIKRAKADLGAGNFLPAYVRLWHLRHAYSCEKLPAKKPSMARRGSANATVAVV